MSARPTHAYCPSCKEESAIDSERRCLWCGGDTRQRRGGGKPAGVYGKLTDRQLRALHRFHQEHGVSLREISRRIWEKAGYSSPNGANEALRAGFRRLALPVLSQSAATAAANVQRRSPNSPGTSDRKAYKRWLRERSGGYRRCQGVKSTAPERGRRCTRYAAPGSDFCYVHDPERRSEVVENVERMRARLGVAA